MTVNAIHNKLNQIKELQRLIDEAQEEMESLKDDIKEELTTRGVQELEAGCFKVSYKEVTSKRFDSKTFKAQHGDLYNAYVKETTSRRFTIA